MKLSEYTIWQVWGKGIVVGSNDPVLWRMDECGAWIFRSHYGNRNSEYGWEIDHIKPESQEGTYQLSNLRPLHWKNIERKPDGSLDCHVIAESYRNIDLLSH